MLPVVEFIILQGMPLAVRPASDIGDHGMDMQLGFLVPVYVMKESSREQIAGAFGDLMCAVPHACLGKVLLDPAQCRGSSVLQLANDPFTRKQSVD